MEERSTVIASLFRKDDLMHTIFTNFQALTCTFLCSLTFALTSACNSVDADDWKQWMGPNRDGVYQESGIIDSIPQSGLKVKWRVPIHGGYAGPAAANNIVYVFDYKVADGRAFNNPGKRANLKGQERLIALDAKTGEEKWQHAYDCPYSISYPAGPRCTPTIDGDRVYILGSEGDLKCLNTADGTLIWETSLKNNFKAEVPIWGFSSHPLVDGEMLYTMVGGEGQGIVAFDKMTGDVRWKALNCAAGYCPPTIIEKAGVRQLIVFHPDAVCALDPSNGKSYWSIEIKPQYNMSICRPMLDGNLLYASGIGNQSVMLKLNEEKPAAKVVWRGNPRNSVYGANATPIFVNGVLYGSDCMVGKLFAVDGKDGKRLWETFEATQPKEKRRVGHGTAFLTRIGDSNRYIIMSETGDLMLANLTPEKFESLGRFHVLEPTGESFGRSVVWSHPAYANRTAYVRNDKEIVAVDISKR